MRNLVLLGAAMASLVLVGGPGAARADNTSILTLGVGAGVGMRHTSGDYVPREESFVNQASVRLKMLWVLGADLSIDLGRDKRLTEPEDGALVYASKMRLTGLLYALPTRPISVYVGGGLGAPGVGSITQLAGEKNSYHVGGGVEIHLTEHFTVDLSYYMLMPSVGSVKSHVEKLALDIVDQQVNGGGGGSGGGGTPSTLEDFDLPDATVGDFVNGGNYEIMLRIFIFL